MQKWSKEGDFAKALQNGTTLDQQLAAAKAALTTAQAEIEALRAYVEDVAKQWLPGEPEPFDDFDPCLEDGYRLIVERARTALSGSQT